MKFREQKNSEIIKTKSMAKKRQKINFCYNLGTI